MTKRNSYNNRIATLDLELIKTRREQGLYLRQIAEELGVALSTISNALKLIKERESNEVKLTDLRVCFKSERVY